ncbi:hypothetical protein [Niallia nealsonii]|nr:hypothetical protein [Niallia nealsonii]
MLEKLFNYFTELTEKPLFVEEDIEEELWNKELDQCVNIEMEDKRSYH